MSHSATAEIFMTGQSQAVRLPKEFELPGKEMRITKTGSGILLEPIHEHKKCTTPEEMWAAIDAITGGKFEIDLPKDPPVEPEDIFGENKS